jgi:modulator of FtsH protease
VRSERRAACDDRGVSVAYDPAAWSDLFVATAGATAALAGLLFVAVSINVERILDYDGLAERGVETLILLLAALVVSIAGLMPGQSHVALGLEILAITAALVAAVRALPITHELPEGADAPAAWMASRRLIRGTGPALLAIGGLTELLAGGGGLYWVAAGFVFLILGAVANAWVLLVEILR